MNFHVTERRCADLEEVYSLFEHDYLHSDIYAKDLRYKYGLTWKEFREMCHTVKEAHGIIRRPRVDYLNAKYYYKHKSGWIIQRRINQVDTYFGIVPTRRVAVKVVELCKKAMWDIDVCREICKNWRSYIV